MSFARMSKPVSSLWRLFGMLFALLAILISLVGVLSYRVLNRAFDELGQEIVLDDLKEYRALWEREGIEAVTALFAAGNHQRDQSLRLLDRDGRVLLSDLPDNLPDSLWPEVSEFPPTRPDSPAWVRRHLDNGGNILFGRQVLPDGRELWFGRLDDRDQETIHRVYWLLGLAWVVTLILAVGPIFWFGRYVLKPLQGLMEETRSLAPAGPTLQRITLTPAIPEIQSLVEAFNSGLEQVHRVTGELESANDQLAHELRTPLARIRGHLERMLHAPPVPDSGESPEAVQRAIQEIDRSSRLIQSILTIRAGEARTLQLRQEPVSVAELVANTGDLYAAAAEERGLELRIHPGPDLIIHADRERLQQVLCILLDNALAYTPAGGRIEVQWGSRGKGAVLEVLDTGPGLSAEDLKGIWQRFRRGSAASAAVPGLGLGLSLVRSIVETHRGEAGAENRPGGGSRFWIWIP